MHDPLLTDCGQTFCIDTPLDVTTIGAEIHPSMREFLASLVETRGTHGPGLPNTTRGMNELFSKTVAYDGRAFQRPLSFLALLVRAGHLLLDRASGDDPASAAEARKRVAHVSNLDFMPNILDSRALYFERDLFEARGMEILRGMADIYGLHALELLDTRNGNLPDPALLRDPGPSRQGTDAFVRMMSETLARLPNPIPCDVSETVLKNQVNSLRSDLSAALAADQIEVPREVLLLPEVIALPNMRGRLGETEFGQVPRIIRKAVEEAATDRHGRHERLKIAEATPMQHDFRSAARDADRALHLFLTLRIGNVI